MESINSFNGGMSSDLSKTIQSKDSYLQALNFRAITDLGGSNGSLVNIKGNECGITFPQLNGVYKLQVVELTGINNQVLTITVNGETTDSITISQGTQGFVIYNSLKRLSNCYESTNLNPTTATFAVAYEDDYVVIYQQPVYAGCSIVETVNPVITLNSSTTDLKYAIKFIDSEGENSDTQVNYVTGSSDFRLIGSTFIREEIYLLTESYRNNYPSPPNPATDIPSNDSFTGVGSIWKLVIDDITREHTLTLVYSNYLDFTQAHPVAPTAITGRYESDQVKRIYWTDFYNKIRTINVAKPQLMALNPILLSIFPSVSFELPILQDIPTGSLLQGTYEIGYRLKKANTLISNYSQLSNMVNLLKNPNLTTKDAYRGYEGPLNIIDSGCGLTFKIDNVDTNFDYIEYVILYRNNKTDLPIIYVTPVENIGSSGTLTKTITSVEDLDTLDLLDYLNISSGFTHAKTVDTKDNRLFWGNVYDGSTVDISTKYDSRTFRSSSDTKIWLKNNSLQFPYTLEEAINTPQSNDNINEYYDITGNESSYAGYYKPGSGIIGGKGKYIEYEFGTQEILLSNLAITQGNSGDFNINADAQIPDVSYNQTHYLGNVDNPTDLISGTTDSDDQLYPMKGIGLSKNPYFTSTLKGFQHEEIYRFGIQFFDLQGNPYFTQWIGDIKMPKYGDTNTNKGPVATNANISDFRNSFYYNGSIYGQALCIKFTVNVTPIKDLISGYQIVRVERTEIDKTILGTGMLTNTVVDLLGSNDAVLGGGLVDNDVLLNSVYQPFPTQHSFETLGQANSSSYSYGVINESEFNTSCRILTYDSFDLMTTGYSYKQNDKLLIRSVVKPINRENAMTGRSNCRYRFGFQDDTGLNLVMWLSNDSTRGIIPGSYVGGANTTGFDSSEMPFFMLFYADDSARPVSPGSDNIKDISFAQEVGVGGEVSNILGTTTFKNSFRIYGSHPKGTIPGLGARTIVLTVDTSNKINSNSYGCDQYNGKKLMALYYRPNTNQYNGNTYAARTTNQYIACGSYIPVNRNGSILTKNITLTHKVFGGDVFLNYWDLHKIRKNIGGGTYFRRHLWIGNGPSDPPGRSPLITKESFNIGNTYYIPCTNSSNQQVRFGNHADVLLNSSTYNLDDEYNYNFYHSNEKNIKKFIPKPLDYILTNKWINRIHYSEKKYNNEVDDSWTQYLTNNYYDVEGNYGEINALIALNNQLHYIQERAIGMLLVNPVAMLSSEVTSISTPIKLGLGSVIERHEYRNLDVGTKHQWSVYKSQNQIMFLDVRNKKLYLYDGQGVNPISDTLGQRNFIIKKLHDNIIVNDNPVIGKGVLTTYDYAHNEFIITFLNDNNIVPATTDEFYTISFSEQLNKFVSYYSFTPNLYVNNNRYLLSNVNSDTLKNKVYLHNYGDYGKFYGVTYPNSLKLLVNEQPLYTKVFDNLQWLTESINDNLEWSDDLNITPGAITSPSYPDDIQIKDNTFSKVRVYNQYQNTDWTTLTLTPPNNNLRKLEQGFNFQIPRNKFNYNTTQPSTNSLFESSKLTRTTFGERIRDKWSVVDLYYVNSPNLRFIVHTVKSIFRISDR